MSAADGEGLEVGRRIWDAFNAGEMDAFWELVHPDCVMATDARWPGGGEYNGREAYRRFLEQFMEAFAEVRFAEDREPEHVGDWTLFHGCWVGSGASTGIESASPAFTVAILARDGTIREARFFFVEDEAREFVASRA